MFGRIGMMELAVVLVIALIIFGPSRLPELGKSLGQTIKAIRSETKDITQIADDVTGKK